VVFHPQQLGFRFKMEDPRFVPFDNNRKLSPPVMHASKTFVATAFLTSL